MTSKERMDAVQQAALRRAGREQKHVRTAQPWATVSLTHLLRIRPAVCGPFKSIAGPFVDWKKTGKAAICILFGGGHLKQAVFQPHRIHSGLAGKPAKPKTLRRKK